MAVSSNKRHINISNPLFETHGHEPFKLFSCTSLARVFLQLRPRPTYTQSSTDEVIRVVCISDTHNSKPDLPPGDILLHAGDLSDHGTFKEIQAQLDWLKAQPHKHKIVVAGNHDLLLDRNFVLRYPDRELDKLGASATDLNWGDIVYLEDNSVNVACGSRKLKIFGSPYIPRCGSFAFQSNTGEDRWRNLIPEGTEVVLTHGPPALYLDGGKGSRLLLRELLRARPSLVVFGHIHNARGRLDVPLTESQRLYGSIALGEASWLALPLLLWQVFKEYIWRPPNDKITMVNAACWREHRDSVTVDF